MDTTDTSTTLRAWAKGIYPLEAGVELVRCGFAGPGRPWVRSTSEGRLWVEAGQITEQAIAASGGEQRILVVSVESGEPVVELMRGDLLRPIER